MKYIYTRLVYSISFVWTMYVIIPRLDMLLVSAFALCIGFVYIVISHDLKVVDNWKTILEEKLFLKSNGNDLVFTEHKIDIE